MRSAWLVVVLAGAGAADADVVSDEQRAVWAMRTTEYATTASGSLTSFDSSLDAPWRVEAEHIEDGYAAGHVRADATLGATMGLDRRSGIGASVDVSYDLPMCRVIGGSASGQLGYADTAEAAWTAGVAACVPLPFDLLWGSYGRAENVRGSLLDGVMKPRERTSSDVFDLHARFYRDFTKERQLDIIVFDLAGDAMAYGGAKKMEMAIAHWHRRGRNSDGGDQTFRLMQVSAQYVTDENNAESRSATSGEVVPVAVDGIAIAPHAQLAAMAGWAHALAEDGDRRILDKTGLHAEVGITVDAPFIATIRARHSMLAAIGGQLVRDDRVSVTAERSMERCTVRTEAFVARDAVIRDMPGGRTLFTGGGALDGAWSLHRNAMLVGRVEAGRTLDAVMASEPVNASWDVRATIGLQTHYGTQR